MVHELSSELDQVKVKGQRRKVKGQRRKVKGQSRKVKVERKKDWRQNSKFECLNLSFEFYKNIRRIMRTSLLFTHLALAMRSGSKKQRKMTEVKG